MAEVNAPIEDAPIRIRVDHKSFAAVGGRDEQVVLSNIAFDVAPRSFVIITGPSGCGKSTLLNIVAGLDKDFDGSITFGNASPRLSFIFQSPRLLPWRTVEENLRLSLPDGDPRQALIPEMLTRVGLTAAANAYPERISLGMQRRAALARGFIQEPDILLMDEPFVSLDDPTAHALRETLIDLCERRPVTVLFVTHDRYEAVMLASRIIRLAPGTASIVQDETVGLSTSDRKDRDKVSAEQRRIFRTI
jgi:ABC-type nitrate/sulfonate/bicarbonate transport system ATPase subunit